MYDIKTFHPDFINDQVRIGSSIYDHWPMGGQTRADQLRKTYSPENPKFDPETKFYAFKGDEMVGFLTTGIRNEQDGKTYYFFEFPYVLSEHAPKVEKMLIEHALKELKTKGADVAVARAGTYWGKSKQYAEQYGFVEKDPIVRRAKLDPKRIQINGSFPEDIAMQEFNPKIHFDGLIDYVMQLYGMDKETAEKSMQLWKSFTKDKPLISPWDQTITLVESIIAIKDDKIISRAVSTMRSNYPQNWVLLNHISADKTLQQLKPLLLKQLLQSVVTLGKDYLVVHTGPWGIPLEEEAFFEQYGVTFDTTLSYYEKQL